MYNLEKTKYGQNALGKIKETKFVVYYFICVAFSREQSSRNKGRPVAEGGRGERGANY